jgi:hypothetical protein
VIVRARVLTGEELARILGRRRQADAAAAGLAGTLPPSGDDDGEPGQGKCPACCQLLYLYLTAAGGAWTCGCSGPEKGRAAKDRARRRGRQVMPPPK